jgi:hypothetical protein
LITNKSLLAASSWSHLYLPKSNDGLSWAVHAGSLPTSVILIYIRAYNIACEHETNIILIFILFTKIFFMGSLRERNHWGELDVDGRIILRGIFRKWEGVVGTGWSGLRIGKGGRHL